MSIEIELKRTFKTGKALAGIKETEKSVIFGKAKGIIVSSDIPKLDFLRLKHLCKLEKVPFLAISFVPIEIGKMVGLSYPIGALSVLDEGKSKILQEIQNPTKEEASSEQKVNKKTAKKQEKKKLQKKKESEEKDEAEHKEKGEDK